MSRRNTKGSTIERQRANRASGAGIAGVPARERAAGAAGAKPPARQKTKSPRHIKVPKPPKSAYNPDRPVSSLIANQVRHLHHVEGTLSRRKRTGIDIGKIETERQASRYIQKVTRALHPQGARTVRLRRGTRRVAARKRKK